MEALIPCSILGLAGWWWLLRRAARTGGGRAPAGQWRMGDAFFAGTIALYFIFVIVADSGEQRTLKSGDIRGTVIFIAIAVLLVIGVVSSRGRSLQAAFGLSPDRPLRVVAIGVACIALTYPVVELAVLLATNLGGAVNENDEMMRYFRSALPIGDRAWVIVLVVVAAPFFEELVFRGLLYGVAKHYVGRVGAALTIALLFAAVHMNLPAMPAYFLLGIALTLAYEITGSLWASVVMHMLFNSIPVVAILWFPKWIQ
ncbi:MAG: lysostaphin resistance A-like protein [Chthoniobacterales bacterium]